MACDMGRHIPFRRKRIHPFQPGRRCPQHTVHAYRGRQLGHGMGAGTRREPVLRRTGFRQHGKAYAGALLRRDVPHLRRKHDVRRIRRSRTEQHATRQFPRERKALHIPPRRRAAGKGQRHIPRHQRNDIHAVRQRHSQRQGADRHRSGLLPPAPRERAVHRQHGRQDNRHR